MDTKAGCTLGWSREKRGIHYISQLNDKQLTNLTWTWQTFDMSLLACTTTLHFNLLASSLSLLPAYYGQVCLHTEGPTTTGCLNSAERFTVAHCWRDIHPLFPGKGIPLLYKLFSWASPKPTSFCKCYHIKRQNPRPSISTCWLAYSAISPVSSHSHRGHRRGSKQERWHVQEARNLKRAAENNIDPHWKDWRLLRPRLWYDDHNAPHNDPENCLTVLWRLSRALSDRM